MLLSNRRTCEELEDTVENQWLFILKYINVICLVSMLQLSATAKEFVPSSSARSSAVSPPLAQPSAAEPPAAPPQTHHKPPSRTLEPPHGTVFDKAMERLASMFPDYTR